MIANAFVYRLASPLSVSASELEEKLQAFQFTECGATQEKAIGFTPARGKEHGALVEVFGGDWILKVTLETKAVPAKVIKKDVDKKCEEIEASTGRKPGKKERRDITDEVRLTLLPFAFPKEAKSFVWIDTKSAMVVVEGSSQSKADEIVSLLVKAIDGFALALVQTEQSPAQAMAQWLASDEAPSKFTVERECELKASDESKGTVKYNKFSLDTQEIKQHIQLGHMPTRLALTWNDRVSFVLTESLLIKKIAFLDAVFVDRGGNDGSEDLFDADMAILTAELSAMITDLIAALGGEPKAE